MLNARLSSRWQKIKKPLEIFVVIVGCIVVIAMLVVIALAYIFKVNIPGLRGKTLWDWLQLLIIPAVLAVGGYLFNYTTSRTEREVATDRQRQESLQTFIDKISELLLRENLRDENYKGEALTIVRARTLAALPGLDGKRKGDLIQFLYDANLVAGTNLYGVDLNDAILPYARLGSAFFDGAQLHKAYLFGADLSNTVLYATDLREADLREANLNGANLGQADLSGANLTGAFGITIEVLEKQAKSLKGATMPDGSIHT